MPSSYRIPKTFKLKPYQSKARGRERMMTGGLLVLFAIFNLYMMSIDGVISLIFALFFGWSGLKNIALGLRLTQLPERDRAYRISTHGLFKILDGKELARLNLNEIRALWFNDDQSKLSLMTHRGVETIAKEELAEEGQWDTFTTWVERSVTTVIYQADPRLWQELQAQSESMAKLGKRRLLGSVMMILALLMGAGMFFYHSWTHIPFFLQTESSDLALTSLGAISSDLLSLSQAYRIFASLILPGPGLSLLFNLFTLYWVARPLEQLWGTRRILLIYGLGYFVGLFTLMISSHNQLFIGAQCASLAICIIAYSYYTQLKASRHLSSPPLLLKKASSAAFILGFIFLLGQGFERAPSGALEASWLLTAVMSIALANIMVKISVQQRNWVLSDGEKWSVSLSILCAALPVASVLFAFVNIQEPVTINVEQQLNHYTPSALIELGQRCSGAPLQEFSPLNLEVIEALPTPTACPKETRKLIHEKLQAFAGFYPKLSPESHKNQLKAHPISLGVKALHRTLAIQSFDDLSVDELRRSLSQKAIIDPQDIYGDLLAAHYASEAVQDSQPTLSSESKLPVKSQQLKLNGSELRLELDKGQLTWTWDFDGSKSSTEAQSPNYSDILWLKVYDDAKQVSKLVMLSFPSRFDPKRHKALSRRKRLGSRKQASAFTVIRHEPKQSQYQSLLGARVRSYSWEVSKAIKAWLMK